MDHWAGFGTLLFLSSPRKETKVNNYASLICGRHPKGTKTGPNEAEIRLQLEPQRPILQRFVVLQFELQRCRKVQAGTATHYLRKFLTAPLAPAW